MGISIKNERVEAAIRELARLTNQGVTDAVEQAVREALERQQETVEARVRRRAAAWAAARASIGKVGPIDQQAVDDEMYDERGLPR